MCMCERLGQLPLLSGMRFARHLHVMKKAWGWGDSPRPGDACGGASLSGSSLDPPDEVRGRAGYLAAPGAGVAGAGGESFRARDVSGEARHGAGLRLRGSSAPLLAHRGPAALRPRGAVHRPWEGASGCSFTPPGHAGWAYI